MYVNPNFLNAVEETKAAILKQLELHFSGCLLPNYRVDAILTATFITNNLPSQVLNNMGPVQHVLSFFPSSPIIP